MKTQFFKLATALLLMLNFSCENEKIHASSEVVSRSIDVSAFSSIGVGLPAQVYVTQGTSHSLMIETHANLFDVIDIDNIGGSLFLKTDHNIRNVRTMNIFVHAEDLDKITLAGSGSININDCILTDQLEVKLSGSGDINMCGQVEDLLITLTGSGNVNSYGLQSTNVSVNIEGSGNVETSVFNTLDVGITGSGNVNYKGSPTVTSQVSGSGTINKMD